MSDNEPEGKAVIKISEMFYLARRRKGLSIVDLAQKSGVHRNTISAIEHGKIMTVRISTLIALAEVLDCDFAIKFIEREAYR